MSASQVVPLTVTYAPSGAATTTATVLGQVLNNGGTNWIPTGTSDNAIYLLTSGSGPSTVLDGTTYYLSNGPAVPAQVTISASGSGSSGSASAQQTGSMSAAGTSSMAGGMSSSMGSGQMTASSNGGMSASQSASAAASSSSTSGAGRTVSSSAGNLAVGLLCVSALGMLFA